MSERSLVLKCDCVMHCTLLYIDLDELDGDNDYAPYADFYTVYPRYDRWRDRLRNASRVLRGLDLSECRYGLALHRPQLERLRDFLTDALGRPSVTSNPTNVTRRKRP